MDLKIFSECIDWKAREQIYTLMKQKAFENEKVRIMPDCHAGSGCVIGFTSTMSDKVIANVIGVDIGCGMRIAELGDTDIDLPALDEYIKRKIPAGMEVGDVSDKRGIEIIERLRCKRELKNLSWLERSLGSLGGGNHFIEVDKGAAGLFLVVHSGSRNLGKQVAEYYQKLAIKRIKNESEEEKAEIQTMIENLKAKGEQKNIPRQMEIIKKKYRENTAVPNDLCYLEGADKDDYMHDMRLCQRFAVLNRTFVMNKILNFLGAGNTKVWESVHNYIDDFNIVRKGAISAHRGQRVIIPINMRDGCIIGVGKGNPDWNESAPHGAGRIMSRGEAKKNLTVDQFAAEMDGIYTTTANFSTLDESPMAYKPMEEILKFIGETVEIEQMIKPVYNFKAGEE